MDSSTNFQYIQLAGAVEEKIKSGIFPAGTKLPSLRVMKEESGLSISTIHMAYIELEKRGLVEPKEKSGFFVKAWLEPKCPVPSPSPISPVPKRYTNNDLANEVVEVLNNPDILRLGCATAGMTLQASQQLTRITKSLSNKQLADVMFHYGLPAGLPKLRQEIIRLLTGKIDQVSQNDIIMTNGCLEALRLCLSATCQPGDSVVVESPCFHSVLQAIDAMGLLAIECATSPTTGIDPNQLEKILKTKRPAAIILNPNFQNPLGFDMPIHNKYRIAALVKQYQIPLIEDDVYGDLYFGEKRPRPIKSFDTSGLILYCSSFSKTLPVAGLRLGYTIPGKFYDQVKLQKINSNISTSPLPQLILATYLSEGLFERHLRKLRNHLKNQVSAMRIAITRYFPADINITAPNGGMLLWVQLNDQVNGLEVYRKAMEKKISIVPGLICSNSHRYQNCIRLNAGFPWTPEVESGVRDLGLIIKRMMP